MSSGLLVVQTTLFSGLAASPAAAPNISEQLHASMSRDRNFFVSLLKRATTLSQLTQLHAQIILHGYRHDLAAVTKLADRLSHFNAMSYALHLFLSTPKPDLFLFNVLIRGFSNPYSISLYARLRKSTFLKPDNFTYAFAVCSASGFLEENVGLLLHANAVVDGYGSDLFVGSALVDFYFKFSCVGSAMKVFDKIPVRDTVLWNTMISGLVKNCYYWDSIRVFRNLVQQGEIELDSTTVAAVFPAVVELQDLRLGKEIQCLAVKVGFHAHSYVLTGLVSLYSRCGDSEASWMLFKEMGRPDLVSYNAMISGLTFSGEIESSVSIFNQLLASGENANSSTVVGLIPVSSPFGRLNLTKNIHAFCLKSGMVVHPPVSTALTTVYSRVNETDYARKLFDESPEKSLASWNAMISGYAQNGLTENAISLFQEMQMVYQVNPNPVTVTSILSACAQLGALSLGKWVHNIVKSNKFNNNIYVSTALIDMYAKCGSLLEARQLFDQMPEKNEVTWNAMISGCGLHGHGQEALRLFHEMLDSSVEPTRVTFLSVLYACSHAGLVRHGEEIFHSMVRDYQLKPSSEHYSCMVDIFGRAGQLDKAYKFIKEMPVEPGSAEWGTLLAACNIHKNAELAHIASERLFNLDPESVGYYVLLSNIYSAGRNYPHAASVRQIVKKRKLEKTPGCTIIEIDETPHTFTSGDRSHPQATSIYKMLEKLIGKMKDAGYQAETATALHDVEEEEKEQMVNVHSEKLAIAFGLIATQPGSEIRIIKNLRVCLDCHTATKFISKVTGRVIVVRDANRFHYFKDGECSCGDYW